MFDADSPGDVPGNAVSLATPAGRVDVGAVSAIRIAATPITPTTTMLAAATGIKEKRRRGGSKRNTKPRLVTSSTVTGDARASM